MNQRKAFSEADLSVEQRITLKEMEYEILQILITNFNDPEAIKKATESPTNIRRVNPDKTKAVTLTELENAFNNKLFKPDGEINPEVLDEKTRKSLKQHRLAKGDAANLRAFNNETYILTYRVDNNDMRNQYNINKNDCDKLSLRELLVFNAVLFDAGQQEKNAMHISPGDGISMKMLDLAINRVMSKIQGTGLKNRGNGYEITDAMKNSLQETLEKYERTRQVEQPLNHLLSSLRMLQQQYKMKGRTRHKKDIQKLIDKAEVIMQSGKPARLKYEEMLYAIEQAFIRQMDGFTNPFLGRKRSDAEFIERVTTKSDFQYPNLLANLLQQEYNQNREMLAGRVITPNENTLNAIQAIKNSSPEDGESPLARPDSRHK